MTCDNHEACSCDTRGKVPPPGSDAARLNGCTCPTVVNANGVSNEHAMRGWIIDPKCEMHNND